MLEPATTSLFTPELVMQIIAVTGTLLGGAVGMFGSWKLQERQLKHEDARRFHDDKKRLYISISKLLSEVFDAIDDHHILGQSLEDKLNDIKAELMIFSSDEILNSFLELLEMCNIYNKSINTGTIVQNGNLISDIQNKVGFISASIRNDLGLDFN